MVWEGSTLTIDSVLIIVPRLLGHTNFYKCWYSGRSLVSLTHQYSLVREQLDLRSAWESGHGKLGEGAKLWVTHMVHGYRL